MTDAALATRKTTQQMVEAYDAAVSKLRNAYGLLAEAQTELNQAFGPGSGDFDVIDRHACLSKPWQAFAVVEVRIRRRAWRKIIDRLEIRKFLSIKRAEDLDKRLCDDRGAPEPDLITFESVFDLMSLLLDSANDMAKEAYVEVFEFLRPARYKSGQKYVTNNQHGRYSIGKRVIIEGAVEARFSSAGQFQINHYRRQSLIAVDRVFHLLDGKPFSDNSYVSPLIDAVQTAPNGVGQSLYFKFRACANGNLHLEFKRPDLVARLNEIAGGSAQLPG